MPTRVAELEAQIRRLTQQRDAQPADTVYALTQQERIDDLSVELIAWQLDGEQMQAAEDALHAAARRRRRAHTGRSRWPATAGIAGSFGALATLGHLASDAGNPPLIGGALLGIAAAALAATAVDRARDTREAAAAETDIHAAQHHYTAVVNRHAHTITALRPLPIHRQETPCASPQPTPSTSTTPTSNPDAAAPTGRQPTASPPSAPSAASSTAVA